MSGDSLSEITEKIEKGERLSREEVSLPVDQGMLPYCDKHTGTGKRLRNTNPRKIIF